MTFNYINTPQITILGVGAVEKVQNYLVFAPPLYFHSPNYIAGLSQPERIKEGEVLGHGKSPLLINSPSRD